MMSATGLLLGWVWMQGGCAHHTPDVQLRSAFGVPETAGGAGQGSWHVGSALCFAPTQGGWHLSRVHTYDNSQGEDRSYNYVRRDMVAYATLYVYPRTGADTAEQTRLQQELTLVAQHVEGVEWSAGGDLTWSLLDPASPGIFVVGTQAASAQNGNHAVGTLAAIWESEPWFVKMRLTWAPPEADWQGITQELLSGAVTPCSPGRRPPKDFGSR